MERAAANLDGFELSDVDAPIVSAICRKLSGIALAIELAAARVGAFSIQQLKLLLDDRFRILNRGSRTAQPRHQSLAAALDWSYEFLPDIERAVLCRLSVFAGAFMLGSAVAVAGDDDIDVVEALANLVAKSLVAAYVGGTIVRYRLLDTTRAYALQKLIERGELEDYAGRHAGHHLDWFRNAETDWPTRSAADWFEDYGRRTDDIRNALNWAFSPEGDASLGVALTVASNPLWLELSLMFECRQHVERALASLAAQPTHSERDELKLLVTLGLTLLHTTLRLHENDGLWAKALALAEKLGDLESQGQVLYHWSVYRLFSGDYRESIAVAEKCCGVADNSGFDHFRIQGDRVVGSALQSLGELTKAQRRIDPIVNPQGVVNQRLHFADQMMIRHVHANLLWLQGFPTAWGSLSRKLPRQVVL